MHNDDDSDDDLPPEEPPRRGGGYRRNNKGGYGNPPVSGQFQPGNLGGPGRRRGATNMETALRKMFRSKVAVTRNGRAMKLDMAEAMAERARKTILSGDIRALELGFRLLAKYGPTGDENMGPGFDLSFLTWEQKIALRNLLRTIPMVDRHEWSRERRAEREARRRKR